MQYKLKNVDLNFSIWTGRRNLFKCERMAKKGQKWPRMAKNLLRQTDRHRRAKALTLMRLSVAVDPRAILPRSLGTSSGDPTGILLILPSSPNPTTTTATTTNHFFSISFLSPCCLLQEVDGNGEANRDRASTSRALKCSKP